MDFNMRLTYLFVTLICTLFLFSCGGDESSNQNSIPFIDAGDDFSVLSASTAELIAQASDTDGTIDKVEWQQISGSSVELSTSDSLTASFTAPTVSADEILEFEVTVTDNEGATNSDSISVTLTNNILDTTPEILSVVAVDTTTAKLAWLEPETSLQNASYAIYAEMEGDFDYTTKQPKTTVSDVNEAEIEGLTVDQTYYFIVVRNIDNQAYPSPVMSLQISSQDVIMNSGVVLSLPEDTGLSQATVISADTYEFTSTSATDIPEVGDIIIGETTDSEGYLRKVTSVSDAAGKTTLVSEQASLDQLVSQIEISSSVLMKELSTTTSASTMSTRSASSANNQQSYSSSGNLLRSQQTNYIEKTTLPVAVRQRMLSNDNSTVKSSTRSLDDIDVEVNCVERNGVSLCGTTNVLIKESDQLNLTYTVKLSDDLEGQNYELILQPKKYNKSSSCKKGTVNSLDVTLNGNELKFKAVEGEIEGICNYSFVLRAKVDSTYFVDKKISVDVMEEGTDAGNKLQVSSSADFDMSMDVLFDYEPTFETNITFKGSKIKEAEVKASLDLSMMAYAQFEATASKSAEKNFSLFKRTFVQVYSAGPVPIYQRITLTLDATASASVDAEVTATAVAKAFSNITFGVRYCSEGKEIDPSTGLACTIGTYHPISSSDFEKEISISVDGSVDATAELRLIPTLEVSFYEVATGTFSMQPWLDINFGAEASADLQLLTQEDDDVYQYQLTALNSNLGLDLYAGLNLDFLVAEFDPVEYDKKWTGTYALYSLPQLSIEYSANDTVSESRNGVDGQLFTVTGIVTDAGENNSFDDDSVEFDVVPRDGIELDELITVATGEKYQQSFWLPDESDALETVNSLDVYFSGWGKLGALARRYVKATINISDDSDEDGLQDVWEIKFFDSIELYSGSDDPDEDGLTNSEEFTLGSYPQTWDSDQDCMPDGWEADNNLDPLVNDGQQDPDSDGLTNHQEFLGENSFTINASSYCSNPKITYTELPNQEGSNWLNGKDADINASDPQKLDSDDDGLSDGWEKQYSFNFTSALNENNSEGDADSDGISNLIEYQIDSNPKSVDTDNDHMPDSWEYANAFDLSNESDAGEDNDRDGLLNIEEYIDESDPNQIDLGVTYQFVDELTALQLEWPSFVNSLNTNYTVKALHISRSPKFESTQSGYDATYDHVVVNASDSLISYLDEQVPDSETYSYQLAVQFSDDVIITADSIEVEAVTKPILSIDAPSQASFAQAVTVSLVWSVGDDDSSITDYSITEQNDWVFEEQSIALANGGSITFTTPVKDEATALNFDVSVSNSEGLTTTGSFTINLVEQVTSTATNKLNDTGITTCSDDDTKGLDCPVAGYEGQDAEYGRDAQDAAGTLTKIGAGSGGFDFTKLDASGNALAASASEWSCVQDNVTGLVWEVKTDDRGLRDGDWNYTWYNSTGVNDGGAPGTPNGGFCFDTENCDTEKYVAAVNSQGLCGASDWRLPSREALRSILDYGSIYPTIDTDYFPNTRPSGYWSSSPSAKSNDYAWYVNFYYGYDNCYYGKSYSFSVRLVRGGL